MPERLTATAPDAMPAPKRTVSWLPAVASLSTTRVVPEADVEHVCVVSGFTVRTLLAVFPVITLFKALPVPLNAAHPLETGSPRSVRVRS